jgi:hypothetical protein
LGKIDPDRAKRIETLLKHPAWPDLVAQVDEECARYAVSMSKALLQGDELNQRAIDFNRGLMKGMRDLVNFPTTASKIVDRVLSEERKPVE